MDNSRSPIIPRQFLPVLENAAETNPDKTVFLVKALLSAWRGEANNIEVPPDYTDAWLALQGNLDCIEAKIKGGKSGGRPSAKIFDAGGFESETSCEDGFLSETSDTSRGEIRVGQISVGEPSEDKPSPPLKPPEGGGTDSDDFNRFWRAYGKRGARKDAAAAFVKAQQSPSWPGIERVCAILAVLRASDEWTRDDGRFQPHAATWLKAERWNDELPPKAKAEADREAALKAPPPHYQFT